MARWTRTVAQREVGSGEGGSRCRRFVACDRLGGIQVTAGLAKAHDFATPSWRVLCAGFTASRSSWSASSSLRFLLPTSSRRAVPAERFIESKNSCETKPTQHHQLLSDFSKKISALEKCSRSARKMTRSVPCRRWLVEKRLGKLDPGPPTHTNLNIKTTHTSTNTNFAAVGSLERAGTVNHMHTRLF